MENDVIIDQMRNISYTMLWMKKYMLVQPMSRHLLVHAHAFILLAWLADEAPRTYD